MAALMRLLVEATGPRGGSQNVGGAVAQPPWLAAATERDRKQTVRWATTLADGAMRLATSRACDKGLRAGAGGRGDSCAAGALVDAVCWVPGALAALVAAAVQEESLRQPDGPVHFLFWSMTHAWVQTGPTEASAETMGAAATQLEPCAAEAAALACEALRAEVASGRKGWSPPMGLLQLVSYSVAGPDALLRLPPGEGLEALVPFLELREPGDSRSGVGNGGGSSAGRSVAACAQSDAPADAAMKPELRYTVMMEAVQIILDVFKNTVPLGHQVQQPGGAATSPRTPHSASRRCRGAGPTHVSAAAAALTGPLIEVAAGRGAATGLRGKLMWVAASCALQALEQSMKALGAARAATSTGEPVAGTAAEEYEAPALFSHPGSAAALAAALQGPLEAAARSSGDDKSGGAVAAATQLLFVAAMWPACPARSSWCREALAARLPSLLLRAAAQLSTQEEGPTPAAKAAGAACLMAYVADEESLVVCRDPGRDSEPSGEGLSAIKAKAWEALVVWAGGSCPEAAMHAVSGALRTFEGSSGAAADLAARPRAATALVGALLRCAAAARAAGPGGGHEGGRMAVVANMAVLLLSSVAAAADASHVEAAEGSHQLQRQLAEEAVRCARERSMESALMAAEAALLRLGAAEGQGGALAADAAAALAFLQRREAPPPLPGPEPLLLADDRRCLACGKGRGGGVTLRRCSGCRAEGVFYCSVEW
jgi:hypothetical protein